MSEAVRVLIVDDHPIVRQGITSLLSNYDEFAVVGQADNGRDALALVREQAPDVVLLDIRLPGESGMKILRHIRRAQTETRVLMLTSYDDDEYVIGALREGAQGFVLKNVSDEMLVHAIRGVARGERVLSPQVTERVVQVLLSDASLSPQTVTFDDDERQILHMLTEGASNVQIGEALFLSISSVKRKLRAIFEKLDVHSRAEAAAEAVRRGVV
jgi:DNA-binding NarL/FixJ family response regulator